jgi:hypothetical protein
VKCAKTQGIRTGNWLSQQQAQALLSTPNITVLRGLHDRTTLLCSCVAAIGSGRAEVQPSTTA